MNFNAEDVERGWKDCECGKRFVLEAGTDYPDECWTKCKKCFSWVVDPSKEVRNSSFIV